MRQSFTVVGLAGLNLKSFCFYFPRAGITSAPLCLAEFCFSTKNVLCHVSIEHFLGITYFYFYRKEKTKTILARWYPGGSAAQVTLKKRRTGNHNTCQKMMSFSPSGHRDLAVTLLLCPTGVVSTLWIACPFCSECFPAFTGFIYLFISIFFNPLYCNSSFDVTVCRTLTLQV